MARQESPGEFLAEQLVARPRVVAAVRRTIAEYAPVNRDIAKVEALLRGRQVLEYAIRHGGADLTKQDYWRAGDILLRAGGRREDAYLLYDLGGLDSELVAYRRRWEERYAARSLTTEEHRTDALLSSGRVRGQAKEWAGVDGARYAGVFWAGPRGGGWPGVVVTNSAKAAELVVFVDDAQAQGWLADRSRGGDGPLRTIAHGPACRAASEEQVLAWLMRHPRDDGISTLISARTWTTHLRAVIFESIRSVWNWERIKPTPKDILLMYESFLVRAPGWAADDIGWPDARHAMHYFQRVAATHVTAAETYMAALALARADATAVSVESPARHAMAGDMRRVLEPAASQGHRLEQAPLLVTPSAHTPWPAGLVPSM
jgi:hypothetical protein